MQSLNDLRKTGSNAIIPEVISLLKGNYGEEVASAIISFLNDLNEQSSVEVFMKVLPKYEEEVFFDKLISACWQNGLNYSKYLEYFIDIVLKKDYSSSFEAFTVVESNINELENGERESLMNKIDLERSDIHEDKKALIKELKTLIRVCP